jgi:putative colanic acid biosynthesis acetyltransferase WcaF
VNSVDDDAARQPEADTSSSETLRLTPQPHPVPEPAVAPGVRVDVVRNRATRRYSRADNVRRVLWALAQPFFSLSPRPFFAWRRLLLSAFGARLGRAVHVYPSTRITLPWNLAVGDESSLGEGVLIYNLGRVTIGARTTVSLRAHVCAGSHDASQPDLPLLKPPIVIGDDAWVAADAFVGPGVTVGDGAIVGARAVAVRDVPPWTVVVGNPARVAGPRRLERATEVPPEPSTR